MKSGCAPLFRLSRLLAGGVCLALPFGQAVPAAELYSNSDSELHWDNTIAYSTAFRLRERDPALIGGRNSDDGDRNFAPGLVSNRFDLFSQLDYTHSWFGFHASAAAWYDTVYHQRNDNDSPDTFNPASVPHDKFTRAVRALHGAKAELVDGFLFVNSEIGDLPFSLRAGRHTLLWGESLFFPDIGIAAGQAPVDDIKLWSQPEGYSRDIFMPVTQLSGSLQLPGGAGIEGYYQFEWRKTRLPGSGSYLSSDDYVDVGGERYILRSGVYLFRDRDLAPPNSGQFGAAFRWSSGQIDFGLYGLRFHAKDPVVYYRSGIAQAGGGPPVITDPSIVDLSIDKGGTYTLAYPRNIEIYGASISGYLGSSTVAAEISARRNTPLANSRIFLTPGQHPDADKNPLYPVGETLQAQISSITTLGPTGLWDSATFRAEAAAVDRLSVWKNAANLDPSAIKLAGAFRVSFQPTYFKVLPNLDLTLDFGLTYRAGTSSIETYQSQGPGNFDVGATATYRVVWSGSVTYSHFLGGAERQPFADRDFLRLSIQRAF
jgi:hypothetical protein